MTPDDANAENKQLSLIIADYLQAVEAGQAPDRDQLLADHPEVAEELREFLAEDDPALAVAEVLDAVLVVLPAQMLDQALLQPVGGVDHQ